jgi:ArsR family metal-binding transcriptional regulator
LGCPYDGGNKMEYGGSVHEIFPEGELVKKVSIEEIRPCIVAENRIRILFQLDSKLKSVIPVLANKYPPGKVNYIKDKKILTLNIADRLVTIYPSGKISMNKTVDESDAISVVKDIMGQINEAYLELGNDNPADYSKLNEKLSKIGPLTIYNCLPKTDCEKCGETTCMAFSIKLLAGDINLNQCQPLHEDWDISCLNELLGQNIMVMLGWRDEI